MRVSEMTTVADSQGGEGRLEFCVCDVYALEEKEARFEKYCSFQVVAYHEDTSLLFTLKPHFHWNKTFLSIELYNVDNKFVFRSNVGDNFSTEASLSSIRLKIVKFVL